MDKLIRQLSMDDAAYVKAMETGIEDDYVKRIFPKLVDGSNCLYGLFAGDQLASIAGYSVFAKRYAMLGRMRSDRRFRGNDFATKLTAYITDEAFRLPEIGWVGANTQENNKPARRILEKLGFSEAATLFGATAADISTLETGMPVWQEIIDLERKKEWVGQVYIKGGAVFPYECYYNFPASEALFSEESLAEWSFYENSHADRLLITKHDRKKHLYLHAIYPWNDLMEQEGLWDTVSAAYRKTAAAAKEEILIWMDLSEEAVDSLPENHPFELPSPWVLYGMDRE